MLHINITLRRQVQEGCVSIPWNNYILRIILYLLGFLQIHYFLKSFPSPSVPICPNRQNSIVTLPSKSRRGFAAQINQVSKEQLTYRAGRCSQIQPAPQRPLSTKIRVDCFAMKTIKRNTFHFPVPARAQSREKFKYTLMLVEDRGTK